MSTSNSGYPRPFSLINETAVLDPTNPAPSGAFSIKSVVDPMEIDSEWIAITPNIPIQFQVYIKTGPSSLNPPNSATGGGRFGVDFYGENGRITGWESDANQGLATPIWNSDGSDAGDTNANYVAYGVPTWQKMLMYFKVPATVTSDGGGGAYPQGQAVVPTGAIFWLGVDSNNYADQGTVWFGDPQVVINGTIPPPPPTDNQITFIAGVGGSISWVDNTNGQSGLTGTFGLGALDNLTVTATPLQGYIFSNLQAGSGPPITTNPTNIQLTPQAGNYVITANFQAAIVTPTNPAPSGSISVGGTPYGGYMYLPTPLVRILWRLRQKVIRPEVHKKLHPLV
ncbi:MAG: hypothetical protein ABSA75_13460 [Candidatus Bathyarchaeia archaeon]|jgi:hypothetical protein